MAPSPSTQSITDLTTRFHKAKGDIPPLLIGASVTIVGENLYLFGGRHKASRQISSKLYVLSLETYFWKSVIPKNTPPTARYFHSADCYENHILLFGGMASDKSSPNGLCALGDIVLLNLQDENGDLAWEYPDTQSTTLPQPRYAHLSSISGSELMIMGGQDIENEYIPEVNVFDCKQKTWFNPIPIEPHYGAYRSAAVSIPTSSFASLNMPRIVDSANTSFASPFDENNAYNHSRQRNKTSTVHVYSSSNIDGPVRQFHALTVSTKGEFIDLTDRSNLLAGTALPPPLRFPVAFACGQYMVIAGSCITPTSSQYHIWALNFAAMAWTRLDAGPALSKGSWLRGALYKNSNRFYVFGHPDRSMGDDYKNRIVSFEYLVSIDTEAFGIYQPPTPSYDAEAQGLGLCILNDMTLADLTIITTDQQSVPVNSAILAQRWPSIRALLSPLLSPENPDPSVQTTHKLTFPDTHSVLVAFLQFIYTDQLLTAQQHQPHILSRLLLIADLFGIARLKELAVHALHQMLNMSTASVIYETAALSNSISLQIRALRVLINAKKMMQRKQQQQQQQQQQQGEQQKQQQQQQQQQQQRQQQQPNYQQKNYQHNQYDRPLSPPYLDRTQMLSGLSDPYSQQQNNTAPAYQPMSQLLQQYDLNAPITPDIHGLGPSSNSYFGSHFGQKQKANATLGGSHQDLSLTPSSSITGTQASTNSAYPSIHMRSDSQRSGSQRSVSGSGYPNSSASSSVTPPTSPPSTSHTEPPKYSRSTSSFWLPLSSRKKAAAAAAAAAAQAAAAAATSQQPSPKTPPTISPRSKWRPSEYTPHTVMNVYQ